MLRHHGHAMKWMLLAKNFGDDVPSGGYPPIRLCVSNADCKDDHYCTCVGSECAGHDKKKCHDSSNTKCMCSAGTCAKSSDLKCHYDSDCTKTDMCSNTQKNVYIE